VAIRVAEGAATRICDLSDGFALQVRSPSDLAAAMEAMRRARDEVVDMGVAWVSDVVAAPAGPLLFADGGESDYEVLRGIPDIVGRHLDDVGVTDALVVAPKLGGVLDRLDQLGPAVVLRLFPGARARSIPPTWVDVAAEWVTSGLVSDDVVKARVLSVEADVRVGDVPSLLHECAIGRAVCEVVMGDISRRIRASAVSFERDGYPHVALAAGGPALDDDALIARADLLEDVGRELAPQLAYACLDIEPTFGWLAAGPVGPDALVVLSALAGRGVPEAFPFQILGPSHIDRLGGPPPGAQPLPGGRYELRIDDPTAEGEALLGPCLVDREELERVLQEPQPLELVPDEPVGEGPVPATVDTLVRSWRAALGAAHRGRLDELERRAAGVGDGEAADRARRWTVADWLVRSHTAAWLRAAGDDDVATTLAGLGPMSDAEQLLQAVDAMAVSINGAAARLEAAPPDDADEEDAEEAWAAASEESAWGAAAEAVSEDVDDHVATSTDLRVIECAGRRNLGDEAWLAARRAIGDVVWRRAWESADALVGGALTPLLDGDSDSDVAGRDALAEAGEPSWDDAVRQASAWTAEARALVGDGDWDKVMGTARTTAEELLARAPDHVARAVLVAVAREASGSAGRAVARAEPEALRPVVDELRESAFALLDRLVGP